MKTGTRFLAAIVCLSAVQLALGGDITGKVVLKGTPPADAQIDAVNQRIKSDPFCGKLNLPPQKSRLYIVGANMELADILVYIKEGLSGKAPEPSAAPAVLDQSGCMYTPYMVALQAGQKLMVKNSDPLFHNINIRPSAEGGNKPSNLAQAQGSKPLEYTFANPEIFIRFECSVHPWMVAYVSVLPHSYFAISGADGTFKIPNVPPGEYVIEAVHRRTHPGGKGISQKIKVGPDGAKADFTIELAKP